MSEDKSFDIVAGFQNVANLDQLIEKGKSPSAPPSASDLQSETDDADFAMAARAFANKAESKEKVIDKSRIHAEENQADREKADQFAKEHKEHNPSDLVELRRSITGKNAGDIVKIVMKVYPDPHLASEAFEFLLTTDLTPELKQAVIEAKSAYEIQHKREIEEAHKLAQAAAAAAAKIKNRDIDPQHFRDLRTLYNEIVHEQYDFPVLFGKLTKVYTYDELQTIIRYMYHELGSQINKLKTDKTEERPLLVTIAKQIRNLQALMGVFKVFNKIVDQLQRFGVEVTTIHFEKLAKLFVELATDHYFSADKVLKVPEKMGVANLEAQSLIIQSLFQATYEVGPNQFFRNADNKISLLNAIREASDILEDRIAELADRLEQQEEIHLDNDFLKNLDQKR